MKTIILSILLTLSAVCFNGCITNQQGQKEIDPRLFPVIGNTLQLVAYEYVKSDEGQKYRNEFEKVVSGIEVFLKDEPDAQEIVDYVKSFNDRDFSPYVSIAISTVADLYIQYLSDEFQDAIPEKEIVLGMLIKIKDGIKLGLEATD